MIGDPRFHSGRDAKRSVKLAKIVKAEVERNRRAVVVEFVAEAVGQPGQPANLHPHGEVLALHMRLQIFAGSGFPLITTGIASTTSAGE